MNNITIFIAFVRNSPAANDAPLSAAPVAIFPSSSGMPAEYRYLGIPQLQRQFGDGWMP